MLWRQHSKQKMSVSGASQAAVTAEAVLVVAVATQFP